MEIFEPYSQTIAALGVLALLIFCQLIVADLLGIKYKHIPGSPVVADHSDLLFRATRTVANTNESLGIFIITLAFSVMSSGSPTLVAYAVWAYTASRFLYAVCYYANLQILRSIVFGASLISIAVLFGAGAATWL
ncbi:MAPEG family protein [Thalassotalea ganghwensis]